jgi:hypothetical protein
MLSGAAILLGPLAGSAEARNSWATTIVRPPIPRQVHARSAPVRQDKTGLVPFETAPFPYDGTIAGTDRPFLNVEEEGRRGHMTPYGRLYWEDETYSDRRVLLHIPKGFDVRKPSVMIVYFTYSAAEARRAAAPAGSGAGHGLGHERGARRAAARGRRRGFERGKILGAGHLRPLPGRSRPGARGAARRSPLGAHVPAFIRRRRGGG